MTKCLCEDIVLEVIPQDVSSTRNKGNVENLTVYQQSIIEAKNIERLYTILAQRSTLHFILFPFQPKKSIRN